MAFDFYSPEDRDRYVRGMREQHAVTEEDAESALTRSSRVAGKLLS